MDLRLEPTRGPAQLVMQDGIQDDAKKASSSHAGTSQVPLISVKQTGHLPSAESLGRLVDPKSTIDLAKMGGVEGLAATFGVNLKTGIVNKEQEENLRSFYGPNVLPHPDPPSFLWFLWTAFNDKILIFLTVASIVSLGIGIYHDLKDGTRSHWIEGAAIMVAVVLVVLVNAVNDFQKDRQFRKLSAKNEDRQIRVLRNGTKAQISIYELCVGDIVLLDPGDVLPADGVLIEGHGVCCDESGATGESDTIKKDHQRDPFFISGAKVIDGSGMMLAIAVGANSFHGRMMMAMQVKSEQTPLQMKLAQLAESIARLGFGAAIFMFLALLIKYLVVEGMTPPWPSTWTIFEQILTILIQAITVIVVAVPEGLPMAVTLALAFATTRMLKDNNLVRVLAACETMGNATTICSDKTGTLTENRMTVVKGLLLGSSEVDQERPESFGALMEKTSSISLDLVAESIAVNSTAFSSLDQETKKVSFIGSKTEAALLGFISRLDYDYTEIRKTSHIHKLYPFASARKSMSTLIKTTRPNGEVCYRLHTKGASEIVLGMCGRFMRSDGTVGDMSKAEAQRFTEKIEEFAQDGLRTISVAFRDFSEEEIDQLDLTNSPTEGLCLLAILGIEDPTRQAVPEAVAACQKAGIFVRMVTGDNKITARRIASRCGIYTRGGIVMEGPQFRQLSDEALNEIVPRLQVLARSSPLDKQILVRKLRELGEVVAVTGDGTNDGPALRAANVGFAMGIAGTEVAKEASSIILMDDNFTSIVKAVSWGRCVNDSVRKFLQFQLTVNVAAVLTAIISALVSEQDKSILSAIQLLWVNLIMDSFAALALATDLPTPDLMDRKPESLRASLITPSMWKMIIGQAIYQVTAMMLMIFLGPRYFSLDTSVRQGQLQLATFIFNSFVFMQLFNEINCRRLGRKFNIFKGIFDNWIFVGIWIGTVLAQILLVFFGGSAFNTTPIGWKLWAVSVALGLVSIPLGALIRFLPDWEAREPERVYMSRERLQWQAAAEEIRRGLSVFHALRRAHDNPIIS